MLKYQHYRDYEGVGEYGGNRCGVGPSSRAAPIRVARVPTAISTALAPKRMFEIRQPIVTPGIADGKYTGSTHSASDILTCITPDERPQAAETAVSAT